MVKVMSHFSLNSIRLTSESFMTEIGLGQIGYDQYKHWTSWATIASISKKDLIHPRKGDRSIVAKSFLVDTNKFPIIVAGKPYNNIGIIKTIESSYKMSFDSPGYLDEIDNNEEILCSIVDLAVNVAKADKDFDKKEGEIIKKWMTEVYKDSLDEYKVETKRILNEQFKNPLLVILLWINQLKHLMSWRELHKNLMPSTCV